MLSRRNEILIGLAVMALSAVILWLLIPAYVTLPRRVPIKALAPSFWPKIICWVMLLGGAALTLRAAMAAPIPEAIIEDRSVDTPELLRMGGLIVILTSAYFLMPIIGMVWICMIVFILLVMMTGSKRMFWGIAVGVALPLLLYVFFTKVAGVAIPQGQFVRLP